jgi:uroporphyrinogen-III synthase
VEIPDVDTIVFLMGLTKLDMILESLVQSGWSAETPVLVISRGTCQDEKVVEGNLTTIFEKVELEKLAQPALIIAGPTVKFWDRQQYHRGHILYTGTNPEKFRWLGDIAHFPMIKLDPTPLEPAVVKDLMKRLDDCHMILLTSRFSVQYFFQILNDQHYDLNRLKEKDFVVIGKNTAAVLRQYHMEPALVSPVETSAGLLEAMLDQFELKGKKILFPRSSLPNHYLKDGLTKQGAQVDPFTVYHNTKLPKRDLPSEGIDKILFTSPSTVHNFLRDYGTIPGHWKILSKGPYTSQSLREAGYSNIEELKML